VVGLVLSGCTSKSKADAKARAAYAAGRQNAMLRMHEMQGAAIRVIGNVRNPIIVWTDNLTLAQAIITAEYQGAKDPLEIILTRDGQQFRGDPKQLLHGQDIPLQAGDTMEIRP
jgi:hypothetical protein